MFEAYKKTHSSGETFFSVSEQAEGEKQRKDKTKVNRTANKQINHKLNGQANKYIKQKQYRSTSYIACLRHGPC